MGASSLLGSLPTVPALPPFQSRSSPRCRQRGPWQKQLMCTAERVKESNDIEEGTDIAFVTPGHMGENRGMNGSE